MKLYTEEQVRNCYSGVAQNVGTCVKQSDLRSVDEYLNSLTPIELPSDEEIEEAFTRYNQIFTDRIVGAKWVIEQIKKEKKL